MLTKADSIRLCHFLMKTHCPFAAHGQHQYYSLKLLMVGLLRFESTIPSKPQSTIHTDIALLAIMYASWIDDARYCCRLEDYTFVVIHSASHIWGSMHKIENETTPQNDVASDFKHIYVVIIINMFLYCMLKLIFTVESSVW